MAEAERSEENGGLEPCPDAGSWVKEKEAEEKQEAWRPGAPPHTAIHYEAVHCDE